MKLIKILLLVSPLLLLITNCGNKQIDGGPCEYADIAKRVKIIEVKKDSAEVLLVELQVVNGAEKIRLNRDDFEIMQVKVDSIVAKSDTTIFLLSGRENISGTCQPMIWHKMTIME